MLVGNYVEEADMEMGAFYKVLRKSNALCMRSRQALCSLALPLFLV